MQEIDTIIDQSTHRIDDQNVPDQFSNCIKIDTRPAGIFGQNAFSDQRRNITDHFRTIDAHHRRDDHQDQRKDDPAIIRTDISGQLFHSPFKVLRFFNNPVPWHQASSFSDSWE